MLNTYASPDTTVVSKIFDLLVVFVNFLARDKGRSWQKENGRKRQERNTERKAKKFGWSWRFPTNSRWKNNPSLPYARSRYKFSRLCSSPTVPLGDSIFLIMIYAKS